MKYAGSRRGLHRRGWLVAGMVILFGLSGARVAEPQTEPQKSNSTATAPAGKQKTFSSAQDAAAALYQAARDDDESGMMLILGPGSHDVVMWTDSADDRKAEAGDFAKKYDEMHRLVKEPDAETTLYIGAENWPLPLPLVEKNGLWYFDAALGSQEIVFRRVGENEMRTIDTLHALYEAENEYYEEDISGSPVEYAPRIQSDPGSHDGLFW